MRVTHRIDRFPRGSRVQPPAIYDGLVLANYDCRVPAERGGICLCGHRLWSGARTCRTPGAAHAWLEGSAVGVLFGLATSAALLMPVHFNGGASVSGQMVLLALAAPLGGIAGALSAAAVACVGGLLALQQTGSLSHAALLSSVLSVAAGMLVHWFGAAIGAAAFQLLPSATARRAFGDW